MSYVDIEYMTCMQNVIDTYHEMILHSGLKLLICISITISQRSRN